MTEKNNFLMSKLKQAGREYHIQLMHQPYFQKLLRGLYTAEDYLAELCNLDFIYSSLENIVSSINDERLLSLTKYFHPKSRFLKNDIQYINDLYGTENPSVLKETETFVAVMQKRASGNKLNTLGYIYVFEGSTLGAHILGENIRQQLSVGEEATSFFNGDNKIIRENWNNFINIMNTSFSSDEQIIIINASKEAFANINLVYQNLVTL